MVRGRLLFEITPFRASSATRKLPLILLTQSAKMRRLIYEYDKAWVDLGYKPNMASGKLMLPPPVDVRRVYHFLSADHAIANIALRRLKVSRAAEMNDPYELLPFHNKGEMRTVLRAAKEFVDENFRFLCFSADWGSPVMWAHYADRHRGISLGLDMLRVNEKRVDYRKARTAQQVPSTQADPATRDKFVNELITAKCDHWKYEEEIRAIVPIAKTTSEGNIRFFHFDETLRLAEVIIGLECSTSVESVRALVHEKHPNAYVFGTRQAKKWFQIVPDEETAPWLPTRMVSDA
jgi:hypothetical protein